VLLDSIESDHFEDRAEAVGPICGFQAAACRDGIVA
jgi:hypothetical protein